MSGVPPDYVMPDYRMTVRFALCFGWRPLTGQKAIRRKSEAKRLVCGLQGSSFFVRGMWVYK